MNTRQITTIAATITLSLVLAGFALAGGTGGIPAVSSLALDQIQLRSFPSLDTTALALEDLERDEDGLPYRFAVGREVDVTPENSGTWESLDDGRLLWRHRFRCPGSVSLNLGFTGYFLPQSAVLRMFAVDGTGPVFRFDADDNRSSGELWTPLLATDELVVELEVAAADRGKVVLELGRVNCGYRGFGEDSRQKSGSCNIDVICSEGDDWRGEIPSIGWYTLNGLHKCSGVMVNNTAKDERPLFLTANHCEISPENVATMVVYWNFESPTCGEHGGGSTSQFTNGETLLASSGTSDFALVELAESPDPVFGVTYAGWDRSDNVPSSAVCIHHPSTDEKSISFEDDPLAITTYLQETVPGNNTHLKVADWDLGTTEGGSSGSPLFNSDHRIVGQLHGGFAACGNDRPDWYGRLFISWEGDGTPETRLRDYLDPTGSGVMFLSRLGVDDPDPEPEPPAEMELYLAKVWPNPSIDQEIHILFRMNKSGLVQARIFNSQGSLVKDLGEYSGIRGENTMTWDGTDEKNRKVSAGLYLIRLESGSSTGRGQVIWLK